MSGLGWKTVPTCSPRIFQTSPAGMYEDSIELDRAGASD